MKNFLLHSLILGIIGVFMCSCEEVDTLKYENNPAINFKSRELKYSFITNPELKEKTLTADLVIMGFTTDYDREVNVIVVTDSTTASGYKILPVKILKNEYTGKVEVIIKNLPELTETEVRLWLKLGDSKDFLAGNKESNVFQLKWSNRLIQPANWRWLRYYFGTYSTRYYQFIIESTGLSEFPYNHPDKTLPPMNVDEVKAWAGVVRDALDKWKDVHGKDLCHDDGDTPGQPIVVP